MNVAEPPVETLNVFQLMIARSLVWLTITEFVPTPLTVAEPPTTLAPVGCASAGTVRSAAWRGARMDAPQLPLYAVLHPDRPTGVAFALAGAAGARHVGVGRDAGVMAGMQAAEKFALTEDRDTGFDWRAITAHWRAWLERLAADVAAGVARVDPKLGPDTCRHCHLAALCRVEAASPADVEEEAADGG